ncbi:Multidrug resistance protein homolog 65 [Gryllus bimaculatus]|nr:Multidrug resistance protein homolog 65 [Gryllus bimaculatus]
MNAATAEMAEHRKKAGRPGVRKWFHEASKVRVVRRGIRPSEVRRCRRTLPAELEVAGGSCCVGLRWAALPSSERTVALTRSTKGEKKKKSKEEFDPTQGKSGLIGLFRYASCGDIVILTIGLVFATAHGASLPALALIFGQMTNTFIQQFKADKIILTEEIASPWAKNETDPDKLEEFDDLKQTMSQFSIYYLYIGIGVLVAAFIQTLCWEMACERQVYRMRQMFFSQMLRQDISWYDQNQSGDLTTKLSDDLERIREGIGCKFSMVLQYTATFFSGLGVGLYANWQLTLVILGVSPLLIGTSGYMAKVSASSAAREQLKYSLAGGIAEEVLSNIRTVAAFGGQLKAVMLYENGLDEGRKLAMKKYYILAVGIGLVFFVTYGAYGLAFWYGSQMIGTGEATPGSVFTVFFSVMAGAFSLGNALPFVNAVSTALGAASTVFAVIDRVPEIDPYDKKGKKPQKVQGHIIFQNVTFQYPTRPEIKVLKDFNVDIKPGQTIALVGSSGAGKSTVVGLLLRFYNLTQGKILLDGVDLHTLNLEWLRKQIGVVSQEPVLFGVSILDNIKYGHDDDGSVVEHGTHMELLMMKGLYYSLVQAQSFHDADEDGIVRDNKSDPDSFMDKSSEHRHSSVSSVAFSSGGEDLRKQMELEPVSPDDANMARLFKLNSPEWVPLLLGCIGCMATGAVMPVFAYFYGEVFATFTLTGEELYEAARFWSGMFCVLAVASGFSFWLQCTFMTCAAEKLVMRLRLKAFQNILTQAVGWFDMETSAPGRLITRLARDAPLIKSASGLRAGQMLGALVTLAAALAIAFCHGWKLALLLLVAVPILAGAAYQQMMILRRTQRRDAELLEEAGKVASESIQNIRTVQALGKEALFVDLYMEKLIEPYKEARKQALVYSIIFGFSQTVIYMMYAAAFRFGSYLIEIGDMEPTNVYRVFFALAFCAASIGQTSAYLQDYTKAKMAAALMFQLMDRKTDISINPIMGIKPKILGKVLFRNVHFQYPNRPNVSVLRGLNLSVETGKTLALVGSSGCGKSTVVSLLERFYDPTSGIVQVDGFDIKTLNLPYLRKHIGLVTQEPTLFDCSIWENIAYGVISDDPSGSDSDKLMPQIIQAARKANIHDFISNLPSIVQEALDQARQGRTSIVIAHRLSTIQNADCIAVIHRGRVVEQGSHEELMALKGRYYKLVERQTL